MTQQSRRFHRRGWGADRGFTLVEILIVVVILGILSAIVVPQFSSASTESREATLKNDLRFLRSQIELFRAHHRDLAPDGAAFADQMTLFTDESGTTNAAWTNQFRFGPYLSTMPENPINGMESVKPVVADADMVADDTTGWIYNATNGKIIANSSGTDIHGDPLTSF